MCGEKGNFSLFILIFEVSPHHTKVCVCTMLISLFGQLAPGLRFQTTHTHSFLLAEHIFFLFCFETHLNRIPLAPVVNLYRTPVAAHKVQTEGARLSPFR